MSLEELRLQEQEVKRRIAEASGKTPFSHISVDNTDETLEAMTEKELRQFAAEQEFDVGKARTKEELIKAIKAAS